MRSQHSCPTMLRSRRQLPRALVLGIAVMMIPATIAGAADTGLTSDQVAAEIVRVQGLADRTAQAWTEAQVRAEELAEEMATLEVEVDASSAQHAALEATLGKIAVTRLIGAASNGLPILMADPSDSLQRQTLASVAVNAGAADADQLEAARDELSAKQRKLRGLQRASSDLAADLVRKQGDVEAQLEQLRALKEQVLDREAKRAYEARIAEQRAAIDAEREQVRRQEAAAAARAVEPLRGSGASVTTPPPIAAPTTAPPTTLAPAPASPAVTTPKPTPDRPAPATSTTTPDDDEEPEASAPAPTSPPKSASPPSAAVGGADWICPVAGPTAFGDTWGAARSGGRTHEGVDMMSPAGTPLVAVVSGEALMKSNRLGGKVVSLSGVDGNRYYYAHLSAWEGDSRSVSAGEVIGYVGSTGNTTANHLHFGIYPGGGAAINPYPTVRKYC